MKYRIALAPDARAHFHALSAFDRAKVRDAIDEHLGDHPQQESRSRIKRLIGIKRPQYRLRVDDVRVFYDVDEDLVTVLGIVAKGHVDEWLSGTGEPE